MKKLKLLTTCLVIVMTVASVGQASVTVTLPEFSSPYHNNGAYYDDYLVGTFTYNLMGETIVSATVSGQWGNSAASTTAHNELWLDGVLLADTHNYSPDPYYNTVPWSYAFTSGQFAVLADGSADFHTIQTSEYYVRLGETTLTIETTPSVIPAPGAILLGSIGVGLVGWLRRRRTL